MAQALINGLTFKHADTVIHHIDPLLKFFLAVVLIAFTFATANLPQLAVVAVVIVVPAALGQVLRRLGKLMLASLGFGAVLAVINWLAGTSLVDIIILTVRFLAVIAAFSVFFMTTSLDELTQVMEWFRLPNYFVFTFVTAIQFVPVLLADFTQVIDAQRSRGLEINKGSIKRRFKNLVPVLIPVIVNALTRSDELAQAMESRGYGAVAKPTRMYVMKFTRLDYMVLAILLGACGGLVLMFLALA
jgi:energy-coupling factor transport system permease protein